MPAASGTPWWVPLLSALTGGAVTGAFAIGGIIYAQHQQAQREKVQRDRERERDHYADARTLRDAKRERMRAIYAALLGVAYKLGALAGEIESAPPHWTPERREQHRRRAEQEAIPLLDAADEGSSLLQLETDSTEAHKLYTAIIRT